MPTIAQVEEQVYACEGFQVRLTALKATLKTLPSYDFLVMAPQRWRISDWKTARLGNYIPFIRDIAVLRGDGKAVKTDVQLGHLRDTYYEARYGSLSVERAVPSEVTALPVAAAPSPEPADPTHRRRRKR